MASPPAALTTLLAKLAATGVDFVRVGGLAAVAQGAPLTTHDIDIVHRRAPDNVDALLASFVCERPLRGRPGPPLALVRAALVGAEHNLLMTDLGPLDFPARSRAAGASRIYSPSRSRSTSPDREVLPTRSKAARCGSRVHRTALSMSPRASRATHIRLRAKATWMSARASDPLTVFPAT